MHGEGELGGSCAASDGLTWEVTQHHFRLSYPLQVHCQAGRHSKVGGFLKEHVGVS